jgi:putative tryptophan/tyrosine transport system substrate-binding protein
MRRREFVQATLVFAAWPLAARAQQAAALTRIGYFGPNRVQAQVAAVGFQAFRDELRALGLSEGVNFVIEERASDDPRGPAVAAAELMQWRPDVVVIPGPEIALQTILAAKHSGPIVLIAINFDPIVRGYVKSLAHPGGDITGVVFQQLALAQKQVEILKQAFPDRTRLVALFDAQSADQFAAAEQTAQSLGMQVQPLKLENPPYDFDAAFRSAAASSAQIAIVLSSPLFAPQGAKIIELTIARRLPTMFIFGNYVEAGGLMSYGVDYPRMFQRAADDVVKIRNGAKPADLPIEQADKFEFIVNLRTARAIGVELPTGILLRADKVLE